MTPPWPWALLYAGKGIENRERWSGCDYRGPIALHASGLPSGVNTWWKRASQEQSYSPRESQREAIDEFVDLYKDICEIGFNNGVELPSRCTLRELCSMTGHIVGTALLTGVVRRDGVVVIGRGPGRIERSLTDAERRWWFGGFALVLENRVPLLTPIPCKGALGLWHPPEAVQRQLLEAA